MLFFNKCKKHDFFQLNMPWLESALDATDKIKLTCFISKRRWDIGNIVMKLHLNFFTMKQRFITLIGTFILLTAFVLTRPLVNFKKTNSFTENRLHFHICLVASFQICPVAKNNRVKTSWWSWWVFPEELEEVSGVREVWVSLLGLRCLRDLTPDKQM